MTEIISDKKGAMVLAAGFGTRLKPLTQERPKPLVEVFGRPLICYNLDHLAKVGVEKVVINTHYLGDSLKASLGDVYRGMILEFVHEPEILGTGGGLKNVADRLKAYDTLFLMNADAFVDVDLRHLIQARSEADALSALLLKRVDDAHSFGAIGTDINGRVVSFVNRIPVKQPPHLERMFCGVHLFKQEFLSWVKQGEGTFCINQETYPNVLKSEQTVVGVDQLGLFQDVGTPQRLLALHWEIFAGHTSLNYLDVFKRFSSASHACHDVERQVFCHAKATVACDMTNVSKVFIEENVHIDSGVTLGQEVVIGPDVKVGKGATLERVVVQSGTEIAPGQVFKGGIVYPGGFIQA